MAKLKISATILQGSGLVAKDRNLFGKKTSSDPYVQVCLQGGGKPQSKTVLVGKTSVKSKTLEPVWNEKVRGTVFPWDMTAGPTVLLLRIFDSDLLSSDDAMGDVKIPLFSSNDTRIEHSVEGWYDVDPASAKNATGKLKVKVYIFVERLVPYLLPPAAQKGPSKTGPPKAFITVNGVTKLSPEFVKWKKDSTNRSSPM